MVKGARARDAEKDKPIIHGGILDFFKLMTGFEPTGYQVALTLDLLIVDEASYIEDDRALYDAIVFALGTTNGRFIATSTPASRDSLFYEMCMDDDLYGDFSRHHVSFHDALEPNGPLKKGILEKLERQMREDPWRWQREMLAEFSEDEEAYFNYSMIDSAVDDHLEYVKDLNKWEPDSEREDE